MFKIVLGNSSVLRKGIKFDGIKFQSTESKWSLFGFAGWTEQFAKRKTKKEKTEDILFWFSECNNEVKRRLKDFVREISNNLTWYV